MPARDAIATKATLVVVSCGKAKVWGRRPDAGPLPAQDVYISSPFRLCRRYAEAKAAAWVILSAKYGFLAPTELIADYNVAFGRNDDAISDEALRKQWMERFGDVRCVVSLASRACDARLIRAIGANVSIETPLKGMGLFQRTAWLKRNGVAPLQ